ncbi:MAG TPA: YceI family protein [Acidimicrobiales bacterium]|nr:YceI family protein [Acidimicrobiales bacterium]
MASQRRKLGAIGAVAAVLVVVVGFAGWWFLVRDDAPDEASIDAAAETLDQAAGDAGDADGNAAPADGIDGEWAVDTSLGSFDDFSGTWAGYRVEEELANIGASTAVGRTPDVSGTMTVAVGEVTAVDVEVDMTTLQSDNGQRDGQLGGRGLESDRFPTATFRLTSPVTLPEDAGAAGSVSAQATGDLTIHGVTREVTLDLEAEVTEGSAAVVGQAPVKLTDFDIEAPTGFRVLSINDDATFEFQIFFTRG